MEALKNGTFPVYLDYDAINGYGYATKWFYPDPVFIPFALIGNVTNLTFAYKSLLFVMSILCGTFTYMAVKSIYKSSFSATISALLYTFCIYRLLDLFERAAIGEVLAFTFIPLIMWGLHEIVTGNYKKWYILAIGYSLLIFSHLLSSVLTFIVIILLLLFYIKTLIKEPTRVLYLFVAALVTVTLTVYYWLPMLEQMQSNDFYYEMHDNAGFNKDFGFSLRMLGRSLLSGILPAASMFSVGIGILLTLSVCLAFFVHFKIKKLRSVDVGVIIGIFLVIMCTSVFPWWIWPFNKLSFIQAPWRFFIFVSYFFAIAGGCYLAYIVKTSKNRYIVTTLIVLITVFIFLNEGNSYKKKTPIITPTSIAPGLKFNYHMGGLEYIPAKVPSLNFIEQRGKAIISENNTTKVSNIGINYGMIDFGVTLSEPDKLELPLFYYKGYSATDGKNNINVSQGNNGLVELQVNNSGHVKVFYKGTFIQKFSFYFSILSVLLFCIFIGYKRRKDKDMEQYA